MTNKKESLLSKVMNLQPLGYGIQDNLMLTGCELEGDETSIRTLTITLAKVNPETKKKLAESSVSWLRISMQKLGNAAQQSKSSVSDIVYERLQTFALQVHGLLSCFMTEEEAFEALSDDFFPVEVETLEDIKTKVQWEDSLIRQLENNIAQLVEKALAPHYNDYDNLLRAKIVPASNSSFRQIPKYDVFCEPMSVTTSSLSLSTHDVNRIAEHENNTTEDDDISIDNTQVGRDLG